MNQRKNWPSTSNFLVLDTSQRCEQEFSYHQHFRCINNNWSIYIYLCGTNNCYQLSISIVSVRIYISLAHKINKQCASNTVDDTHTFIYMYVFMIILPV